MNLIEFCIASDYHNKAINLEEENEQLKEIIKKAIDYIEKNKIFYSGLQNEDLEIGLFENEIEELLEILKDKKRQN